MALYAYIARDSHGARVSGRVEAATEQAAAADLSARGLAPVRLEAATSRLSVRARVSTRRLAASYQQLADLLRAGVPLLRALRLLGRGRAHPRLAAIWSQVADDVADGARLADAMARHERIFPAVQVALVRAGEKGAFLEQVLARLGAFLLHRADLNARVIGGLIYPAILLVGGILVIVVSLVFFVPKFRPHFAKMEVPIATRLLFAVSDLFVVWWPIVIPAIAALVIVAAVSWRRPRVRRAAAAWRLRIPKLGSLLRSLAVARVSRVLGTMLDNGIPMIQAMQISRDAAGDPLLAEAIDRATDAVRGGESLAKPLFESGYFDEDVVEMITVGESANNLPEVLVSISSTLEGQIDRSLTLMVRLMEPLLLLVLAAGVVYIFLALVLPLMSLSSMR